MCKQTAVNVDVLFHRWRWILDTAPIFAAHLMLADMTFGNAPCILWHAQDPMSIPVTHAPHLQACMQGGQRVPDPITYLMACTRMHVDPTICRLPAAAGSSTDLMPGAQPIVNVWHPSSILGHRNRSPVAFGGVEQENRIM